MEAAPESKNKVQEGGDGDQFTVFQILKIDNDKCDASDGTPGTCFTSLQCRESGGKERGICAAGFGICCVGSWLDEFEGENISDSGIRYARKREQRRLIKEEKRKFYRQSIVFILKNVYYAFMIHFI